MSDFEYFFTFFGLLLGLTVVEVATKLADAIDAHNRRPIGLLTPLLAVFVLLDISTFWLFTWSARDAITINWPVIFWSLVLAILYFLSAALVFPRSEGEWQTLDEHFWARKRFVLGGILTANVLLHLLMFTRSVPSITEYWFFVHKLVYFGPALWAWKTRSRRWAIVALCLGITGFLIEFAGLIPVSAWGQGLGFEGTLPATASTSGAPAPR